MIMPSNRIRAVALLAVTFVAGGVAGAATYRALAKPAPTMLISPAERRDGRGPEIEAERIPTPLEQLQLTPDEQRSLREIARRWRPRAAEALAAVRQNVSDFENSMFAEMLCVLPKEKQERYLAQLQENGAGLDLIERRFRLVRSNQCPARDGDRRRH